MPRIFWEFSQYSDVTLLLLFRVDMLNTFMFRKLVRSLVLRTLSIIHVFSNANVRLHQFAVHLDRNDVPVL